MKEAEIPPGLPFLIGETRLSLEHSATAPLLPPLPTSIKPWHTQSAAGAETLWFCKRSAETSLSLYLAGETGVGKEVLARMIHAWSECKSGPFVPLHCGALSLSLAESELFGHVKGAYTGAHSHRPGALMQAHGGTLFLDEVGDLPPEMQVKLLRFLENGEIRAVGSDHSSHARVRIVCATHQPLLSLVESGRFRRDLYYRIASIPIEIPTLRSRLSDIELLARLFSQEFGKTLSAQALIRLKSHSWPGNVRELRHAVERACSFSGPLNFILPPDAFEFLVSKEQPNDSTLPELTTSILSLCEMERIVILRALKLTEGHRGKTAAILGIARSTLFEMIKRHRIQGPKSSLLHF